MQVVCRQLGMKGGIVYPNAHFGQNKRLGVLVQQVFCPTGKETSLNGCQLTPQFYTSSNGHATDVGVACKVPCELGDNLGCCCIAQKPMFELGFCIAAGLTSLTTPLVSRSPVPKLHGNIQQCVLHRLPRVWHSPRVPGQRHPVHSEA